MIITSIDSIPSGEGRTFEVSGQRLAIFRGRNGQVFATQADCPHKGGPLADGLLGGSTLICPLHTWKWDLNTGETLMGECPLTVYPAHVDSSGKINVSFPSAEPPQANAAAGSSFCTGLEDPSGNAPAVR